MISTDNVYFLNRMNSLSQKIQLGTLLSSGLVKFAGTFDTVGGDAAESISVPGVVATDIVIVSIKAVGVAPVTVLAAAAGTDVIAVTMSADPDDDHVLQYIVVSAV